jgi:hypothetical protein
MEMYGVSSQWRCMEFHPIVIDQAKGFLREVLDISVDDAPLGGWPGDQVQNAWGPDSEGIQNGSPAIRSWTAVSVFS